MQAASLTAYWTVGVREEDTSSPSPVCPDEYARLFLDDEGRRVFELARHLERPKISMLVRHHLIDELVGEELRRAPETRILLIGAGYDSRAFRLRGGRWLEVDLPALIARKEELLPAASCPNPLERVPLDLQGDSLSERLAGRRGTGPCLVIAEGLLMYLQEEEVRSLLRELGALFPHHRLICDLMSRTFLERYTRDLEQVFTGLGAPFRFRHDAPARFVEQQGYRLCLSHSLIDNAVRLGRMRIPWLVRKLFLRDLIDGSHVCLFER